MDVFIGFMVGGTASGLFFLAFLGYNLLQRVSAVERFLGQLEPLPEVKEYDGKDE